MEGLAIYCLPCMAHHTDWWLGLVWSGIVWAISKEASSE